MAVEFRSKTDREHRADHDKFRDVYNVHFAEGTIKDFGLLSTNPLAFDDTVTVEVGGASYAGVPIFYHCRKDFYDGDVSKMRSSKALNHAAWGYRVGQKVKVMFEGNALRAVVGHNEAPVYCHPEGDPKAPWPCLDVFRIQWHRTIGTETGGLRPPDIPTQDWWTWWFGHSAEWLTLYYRASTQEEATDIDEPYVEPDGKLINTPHRMRHIMGMSEKEIGTIVYYIGDWLWVIGPAAYIFWVYAIGMPGPLTGQVQVFGTVWTPEREEAWLAEAIRREKVLKQAGVFQPFPVELMFLNYKDMVAQTKFQKTFQDRFVMKVDQFRPKWIFTEFWGYDWEREATDPSTPNTIEG